MVLFRESIIEVTETSEPKEVFLDCGDSLPTHLNVDASIIKEGKKIGDGQYGPVHEATWLGRRVAVKKFNLSTCNFHLMSREAGFMVRLRHPNVLRLLGITLKEDLDCNLRSSMIMELMDGDLSKLISARKKSHGEHVPFTHGEAIDVFAQIARGMKYLHERGYTHRDLKPANVMIKSSLGGHVDIKIADFGCSRLMVVDSQSQAPTREGTRQYMAPEVYNSSVTQLDKADVYSFAMMCSSILTGEEPFEGVRRRDLQEHILRGSRPPLPQDLPKDLAELIRKCWDTKADARPGFETIWAQLEQLKDFMGVREPGLLAKRVGTSGEAAQAQNLELIDSMGLPRDLYISLSEISFLRKFAEGGEAEIFQASWRGCQYAVKSYKYDLQNIAHLLRLECRKKLQHQNIVSFFGYSLIENRLCLVMELMHCDLRSMIDEQAAKEFNERSCNDEMRGILFDDATTRTLIKQIADGMAYVHSKNIIHRDLKASNILVSEHLGNHVVRITDFSPDLIGTGFWRAPEILKAIRICHSDEADITRKSDVYSFGMLCYEILSGKIPFEGNPRSYYDPVIMGERPSLPRDASQDLVKLITKCWHPDPAMRPEFSEICEMFF